MVENKSRKYKLEKSRKWKILVENKSRIRNVKSKVAKALSFSVNSSEE